MKKQSKIIVLVLFLGVIFVPTSFAAERNSGAFSQLKALAGKWIGSQVKNGKKEPIEVHYRVTSGGSAVEEVLFPGTPKEMVSVYHQAGEDVLMTHYCMMGNQPRLKLSKRRGGKLQFTMQDATGMESENDAHMGALILTKRGKNRLRHQWTMFREGKSQKTKIMNFKRLK